ncbi:DegT/DnrJ/EryC1/StrS family aminotransferase [Parafrankia sp. BMG5.11]|uniref:DegT/DnrJ/EryC1/StrS family aminotransferase n=1 Tax=Parafrankia sp. BMG5.11 TaxID=222540 RepID=UPI00103C752E|nr:DegT/DnrJ/EryC1/StrS family aminotransferase [Parafrankia sp. BMG5.11]TCJ34782.1 DegT/DnrJ/EryC1/StrS aminotransferase family protein [Parafrankia sp. BMG5.11]
MNLFPTHRIDCTVAGAMYALTAGVRRRGAPSVIGRRGHGPHPDLDSPRDRPGPDADADGLLCLSVRSAFHLLLSAARLPAGSDVAISAVTHPDMIRIIELHGLRPVPVDIDPLTLAVDEAALDAAITDRTRALVVTHLFGARSSLDAAARAARAHGLLLIEDCAQSIQGPADRGDPRADVSLFSFGLLKTATALGGAVAWTRRPDLAADMRARQERWPAQSRREYARRAVVCVVALALSRPRPYGLLFGGARRRDPQALMRSRVPRDERGFTGWLQRRPCPALARTVTRRLARFPANRLRRRAAAGEALAGALPPEVFRPGGAAEHHTYWLFPVIVDDPARVVEALRAAGVDAAPTTSQIGAVEPAPPGARRVLTGLVFLPAYPELPAPRRDRFIAALTAELGAHPGASR